MSKGSKEIIIHIPAVCLFMSKGSKSTSTECNCTTVIVFTKQGVKQNEPSGVLWRPTPLPKDSGRHWRPGTQALHEIRHYQRTTKLLIPRAAFIVYVNYLMYFCVFVSKEIK